MSLAVIDFFQLGVEPWRREEQGLHGLFRDAFPVRDPERRAELVYVSYEVRPPRETAVEVLERGGTYAGELFLVLQIMLWNGEGAVRDIREQRVGFWEVFLPTDEGTFVVEGLELALDEAALRRVTGDLVAELAGRAEARLAARAGDDDLMPADLLLDDEEG